MIPAKEAKRYYALAAAGMGAGLMLAFLDGFGITEQMSTDDRRYLTGPLVVHESAWNADRPKWIEQQVGAERLGIVLGVLPDLIIGPSELVAVMYGASLDAPMRSEYADLYVWATMRAVAVRDGKPVGERFGDWPDRDHVTDEQVLHRRGRLHQAYYDLASDVRRRVVTLSTTRARTTRRETVAAQKATITTPVIIATQLGLF